MTARALLEVADEISGAMGENTWSSRIRVIASSLAEQPAKGECDACGGAGYTVRPSGAHTCWKCGTPQPSAPADADALYGMFRALVDAGGPSTIARHGVERGSEAWATTVRAGMLAIERRFHPERFDEPTTPPTAQRHDVYLEEIAEALGDPTLTSISQIATGIRDLKERLTAHGAGAAVEAVALPNDPTPEMEAAFVDDYRMYGFKVAYRSMLAIAPPQQRSEQGGVSQELQALLDTARATGYMAYTSVGFDTLERAIAALSTQPLLSDQPAGVSNGGGVVDKAVGDSPIAFLTVKPTPSGHGLTGDVQLNDFPSRVGNYDLFLSAPALAHDLAEVVEDLEKHRDECHDRTHWNTYEHCISRIRTLAAKPAALHPDQAKDGAAG